MKPILFVFIFLFPTVVVSAQSQPNRIDLDQEKCLAVKHGTMPRAKCYSIAFEAWEKDVSETYASLRPKLTAIQAKALEASQKEWEKYRDTEFEFISTLYSNKKGTGYIAARIISRIEILKARALLLESRLGAIKGE